MTADLNLSAALDVQTRWATHRRWEMITLYQAVAIVILSALFSLIGRPERPWWQCGLFCLVFIALMCLYTLADNNLQQYRIAHAC